MSKIVNEVKPILLSITRGYLRLGKGLAGVVSVIVILTASSAIIVFPLWYLAANHTRAFTITTLILLAAGLIFLLARRVYRDISGGKANKPQPEQIFFHVLWRIIKKVLFVSIGIAIAALYLNRIFAVAIPVSLLYFLIVGYLAFWRRSSST